MNERPEIPRIALNKKEAARALGMNPQTFNKHVAPHVKAVRCGGLILYAWAELEGFLDEHGSLPLDKAA